LTELFALSKGRNVMKMLIALRRSAMRSWAGLAVLSLPCLLVSLDAEVLNLAAPQLTRALHPSGVQLLWIMDSYVFVVGGALIAMGVLGDRIGRRRLLLLGAAAFGVASLLAAFAATPAQLIAARVLMGLAGASLMPSTLALIRVMFPDPRRRGIALAVWSAAFALGGIAAPLIGGVLLEHFWWGSVFLIAAPVVVALVLLGPVLLPESRDHTAARFDAFGALLSLTSLLLFGYGVKRLAAAGWQPVPLLAIGAALLLGLLFLRHERLVAHPMLDLAVFRDPRVSVAVGSNALAYFVLYGSQLAIAQYLQLVVGLSPLHAGLWALPSVLAYLGASFLGPVLTRYLAAGRVIALGLATMAAGFAVLAAGGLPAVVAGMVLYSIGLAPAYTLATELVVSTVRPARAGMAAAVTETGCELGGALGIAVLGSLLVGTYRHGMPGPLLAEAVGLPVRDQALAAYGTAFAVLAVAAAILVLAGAVVAAVVLRRPPAEPVAATRADVVPAHAG
jgi:DHA2 family multidrug resistance protein-like MFS transporter